MSYEGMREPRQPVEREVFRDPHAPGFHVLNAGQLLAPVPNFDQRLLHNVFRLFAATQHPESEAKKLVFHW